ncbi:MAG TPA: phenylacetate--CoA ligase family protein, partial [Verrucomicrobiae bacterium]|nr:phenylacetate--CoA ligase family protein [Verrucomicrobiae bacterium]
MERAWGPVVYDQYAATETGSIAGQCRLGRMHAPEDILILEPVDREERAVPPGTAADRLLVTALFRRTQPLIRYEISDRVVFSPDPCACGLPWRVIERIEGRREEVLRLPARGGGEMVVHPVVFERVLDNLPCGGWQAGADEGGVSITLADAAGVDAAEVASALLRELELHGVAPLPVRVRRVERLPPSATGKARRLG